jgi:hypothetical protein
MHVTAIKEDKKIAAIDILTAAIAGITRVTGNLVPHLGNRSSHVGHMNLGPTS